MSENFHQSTTDVLQYSQFSHLPEPLRTMSAKFAELSVYVARNCEGPEAAASLRKILEAKDCAVRSQLSGSPEERVDALLESLRPPPPPPDEV